MANVLLGVTGSVAAIRTPQLVDVLRQRGHAVKVVATRPALYFFDPGVLDPAHPGRNPEVVILDEDEWPGQNAGKKFQLGEPVLHIELRRWADALLVAPLDANTLAKLACGLADNCLCCVWRAWDTQRPVVLAPAMNTLMWTHPLTARHLRQLCLDHGGGEVPLGLPLDAVIAWINQHCPRLRLVPPVAKELACGDVGVGGLADRPTIADTLERLLAG